MALPIALGMVLIAATGGTGIVKGASAAIKNVEAENIQSDAEQLIKFSAEALEDMRKQTQQYIKKLGETKIKIASREIKKFVEEFQKIKNVDLLEYTDLEEWKKINFTDGDLHSMQVLSSEALDLVNGGLSGIGTAALVGLGAYKGVTTLATASTGTAISTLYGSAATNATLAWFGGGSVVSGGLGVFGGTAILGGLVAGPMLIVAGSVLESKANRNIDYAKMNLAQARKYYEEVKTATISMGLIADTAAIINNNLVKMDRQLAKYISKLSRIIQINDNWNMMSVNEKKDVILCVEYAQMMKKIMDVSLLGSDGLISEEAKELYDGRRDNLVEKVDRITKDDLRKWKNENVDAETEIMTVIDPLVNGKILEKIELSDDVAQKYFILTIFDRKTNKILRYGFLDKNLLELEELSE